MTVYEMLCLGKVISLRRLAKFCGFLFVLFAVNFVFTQFFSKPLIHIVFFTDFLKNEKVIWEDFELMNYEKSRVGPGEHGEKVVVTNPDELKMNEEWVERKGFYVDVSDKISLTRALPDHRLEM